MCLPYLFQSDPFYPFEDNFVEMTPSMTMTLFGISQNYPQLASLIMNR